MKSNQTDFCAYGAFGANHTPIEVNTISKRTETSFHFKRHLGVPSGASKLISEPMVRLAQTVHLSCFEANTFSKLTETSLHLTHVTYEFHRVRPKMTSEPIACSSQTVHLSCVEINTISK